MALFNITYRNLDSSLVIQPVKVSVDDKNTAGNNFVIELASPEKKGFIELGFIIVEFNKEDEQYNKLELSVSKEDLVIDGDNYKYGLKIGLETCYGVLIFKYYVDDDGIIHEVNKEYSFARFEKAHEEMEAVKNGEYVKKSYLEEKPAVALVERVQESGVQKEEVRVAREFPLAYPKGLWLPALIVCAVIFLGTMLLSLVAMFAPSDILKYLVYFDLFKEITNPNLIVKFSCIAFYIIGLTALILSSVNTKNNLKQVKEQLDNGVISEEEAFSIYRKGKKTKIALTIVSIVLIGLYLVLISSGAIVLEYVIKYIEAIRGGMA